MKLSGPQAFFLILSFFAGFVLRPFFNSQIQDREQLNPQTLSESESPQALKVLTPEMIEDYYRLQSMEEKYKKADELLAKIIIALLQDLGMKISPEAQASAEKASRGDLTVNMLSGVQKQEKNEFITRPEKNPHGSALKEGTEKKNWSVHEAHLEQVQTANQASEFLEKVKIENFDAALKSSSAFKNTQQLLESIIGKYEGSAEVSYSGKARVWQIEIDMDLRMNQNLLRGRSQIKLSENGRTFSNSTDRGEPKNLREFSNESVALMIRASPSLILQVYYLKTSDSFIGNVYRMEEEAINYQYVGTLKLFRKN